MEEGPGGPATNVGGGRMSGTRIGLLLAVGMGLLAAPVAAKPSAVDRTRLDALIAEIEKAEPEGDQAANRALADETLDEASPHHHVGHPASAARELYFSLYTSFTGQKHVLE